MANRGETVKYVIDADTSGFSRGMTEAAIESGVAGKTIDKNLSRTAKNSENNFKDIRRNAQTAASQIRNFGIAFQAFNTTSAIIGVTALSGAVLELSGAFAAVGSNATILVPALAQTTAAIETFKVGISGLGDAFKAISKNDGKAFTDSLKNLGPAATQVAFAAGAINKAFNGIKLNVQQALFKDLGKVMLELASGILPTLNAGMQRVAQSMNDALKQAAALADTSIFKGLLATIFADTARNVSILSGALQPLLTIFTNLYLVTRPYVTLLAQSFVTLTRNAAAYLSSARGQAALNLAIQEGLVALKELGNLVGAVFGLLTAVFRTSVNAGNSLIPTITGIVNQMKAWVLSAEGQKDLIALFNFTSLAIQAVADSIGRALGFFFDMVSIVNGLNPTVQKLIVNFLATSLTIRPLISYISQLYLAIRVLVVTIFNFVEQAIVVFTALGAVSSVVLVLAVAFIALGAIIRGPLGGALIIIGAAIATYIALSYLLAGAATYTAGSFLAQGASALQLTFTEAELASMNVLLATTMYNCAVAAVDAGAGMGVAATAASFLQVALLGIIIAAAGVVLILSMLGVFSNKTKSAAGTTTGFSNSLGGLQKAMKGVGGAGDKASTGGISALNDSLGQVGQTADTATSSLASFDKMNVLTDDNAANAGIAGLPSLPNLDGKSLGAPTLDTADFDKALADMQKNFDGLQKQIGKPLTNPFDALGKWIDSHPWVALGIFVGILVAIAAVFVIIGFAALPVSITIGLIVLAVVALVAIIIILVKNWDTVWATIKNITKSAWDFIVGVWGAVVGFFSNIFASVQDVISIYIDIYIQLFSLAWEGIKAVWGVAVEFFQGIWDGIKNVFGAVGVFFGNVFTSAWTAIKNAFNSVTSFFSGIWDSIRNIFTNIGSNIGNAVGNAFKVAVNGVLSFLENEVNGIVNIINGALNAIDKITPGTLPRLDRVSLPRLAKGGIVDSPTTALIGEAGKEAVVPLENNTEWVDKLAAKINDSNSVSRSDNPDIIPVTNVHPKQANNITIQVSGVFATSVQEQKRIADIIAKQLNASMKSKGLQGAY